MKPKRKTQIINREHWLNEAIQLLHPKFTEQKLPLPQVHVSIGFPSRRATSLKNMTIGQCFPMHSSKDGAHQIFIHPILGDTVLALATLQHEYLHASLELLDPEYKGNPHQGKFAAMYKKIGLEGKPTHTRASPELVAWYQKHVIKYIGEIPHPTLTVMDLQKVKKKGCRQLKAQCPDPDCGYTIRITRKWIEFGMPVCPCGEVFVEA